LGKRVRIVAVDEDDLPPLTLREVSSLGVVAEDSTGPHFYPWAELGAAGLVLVGQDSSPAADVHVGLFVLGHG
jgi:hypothetical protein